MNAVYGSNGFPMLGTFGSSRFVSARSVVANTGALGNVVPVGWVAQTVSTGTDIGFGIATDTSGDVFVTGYYTAAVTLYNSSGLSNAALPFIGSTDCFLAKYSSAGAVLWAARIVGLGSGSEQGNAVATDSGGNVFVTGQYNTELTVFNSSGVSNASLPHAGGNECFIARYSSTGSVLWATRITSGGPSNEQGNAVAADSSCNVFVTGSYGGTLTLYNTGGTTGGTLPLATGLDCFLAKYSSAGAVLWAARIGSASGDFGYGVATDTSGNVFATGQTGATPVIYNTGGTAGATLSYLAASTNCFLAKYSSAGAVLWAAGIAGGSAIGYGVATDTSGNVFVTGQYGATMTLYNSSGISNGTLPFAGTFDCFVAKYSSAGAVLWAAQIAGTTIERGFGIATDTNGDVVVTGSMSLSIMTIYNANGTVGLTLPSGNECFVVKYSSTGVVLWATQIGGAGTDTGRAVATDSNRNVYVTGLTSIGAVYNPGGSVGATIPRNGSFIAKYNPDGYVTPPTPASSNVLVSATYTPSTFSPFVNGFTQSTLAGTTLTTTGIFVGGPSNYFSGSISEVLIFGTTLTAAQRQSVEGYLSRKWGIGTALIITHPYYTIPPFNRYFNPTDVSGCTLWLDAADNRSMNSTTTVTSWSDKSGSNNTMTGTATWTGTTMSFNGSTQSFSNTGYVFPASNYSMFSVYSNTTAPTAAAYMNVVYGSNGFPMLGTFDVNRFVSARSVVGNTGALGVALGWATYFAGAGSHQGSGIATDSSRDVFVSGYYSFGTSTVTFYNVNGTAGATLTNPAPGSRNQACIAKYTSLGTVLWAAHITSTVGDQSSGTVSTDSSGNVFVTGNYTGALTVGAGNGVGTTSLPFTGGNDCFLAKYSSVGAVLWAAQIAGPTTSLEYGWGVAADTSGNVFVSGYYSSSLTLYNTGGTTGATLLASGLFVAKYSSAGAVLWAARITGIGPVFNYGIGLVTDTLGNAYVGGYYNSLCTIYNTSGTAGATLARVGGYDCFLAKYSSAGAVLWAARISSTANDIGCGVAADLSGDVFITGQYDAACTVYNADGTTGATLAFGGGSGGASCFLAKYTSAGVVLWAARIVCPSGYTVGQGVATDTTGNVFVTGYYQSALTLYNANGTTGASLPNTSASLSYLFVAKYTSAGVVLWAAYGARTSVSANIIPYAITTDTSGNVLVTGQYGAAVTLYNANGEVGTTLPFVGGSDAFIVKYSPDGFISVPVPASSNVLVSATYTPSTFSPFINGSACTTLAGTTLATTGVRVGGPSNYFNGTISELLIYSANLSAAQRQQVEGYLIQKWGLSAQTVAGHPYKLIPPATVVP
jgi:hypothetical protein